MAMETDKQDQENHGDIHKPETNPNLDSEGYGSESGRSEHHGNAQTGGRRGSESDSGNNQGSTRGDHTSSGSQGSSGRSS